MPTPIGSPRWLRLALAGAAVAIKLAGVGVIRTTSEAATPLVWLALADPVPLWVAEGITGFVFDQRRLGPTAEEAVAFDAVLLIATGAQWYLCGVVIEWLWKHRKRDPRTVAAR